jgi:hypothetical protein
MTAHSRTLTRELELSHLYAHRHNWLDAIELLDKMLTVADSEPDYDKKLSDWLLGNTSTLALRELAERFGEYLGARSFRNSVNALDSCAPRYVRRVLEEELFDKLAGR